MKVLCDPSFLSPTRVKDLLVSDTTSEVGNRNETDRMRRCPGVAARVHLQRSDQ